MRERKLAFSDKELHRRSSLDSNLFPYLPLRERKENNGQLLGRIPTHEDVSLLVEDRKVFRISSGLSPYFTLPAIGDTKPQLVRQMTYNVLEPKFVRGPWDQKKKKKKPKSADGGIRNLEMSCLFGPRLLSESTTQSKSAEAVTNSNEKSRDLPAIKEKGRKKRNPFLKWFE